MTLPSDFSSANLKVGRSLPASVGSGTLFMKLGSPPAAGVAEPSAASEAIPAAARNSRRCGSDMAALLRGPRSSVRSPRPPKDAHQPTKLAIRCADHKAKAPPGQRDVKQTDAVGPPRPQLKGYKST